MATEVKIKPKKEVKFKRENDDESIYCIKCKEKTPSIDFKLETKIIKRIKLNGETSFINRKVISGLCRICGTKKSIFVDNEFRSDKQIPKELDVINEDD